MNEFKLFRHIGSGVVASYPAHYADHPVFGSDLEEYNPAEYEEDKVAVDTHELPVDQRGIIIANPLADLSKDELVEAAERHGLETKGTKADLTKRLADDNTKDN